MLSVSVLQTVAPIGKLLLSAQSENPLPPFMISLLMVFFVPSGKVISTTILTGSPASSFFLNALLALITVDSPPSC